MCIYSFIYFCASPHLLLQLCFFLSFPVKVPFLKWIMLYWKILIKTVTGSHLHSQGNKPKKKKNGKQHSPASLASIFPKWPCRLLVHVKLTVESWQIFNYDMVYEILPRYQYKCQQYSQAYNILIIDFKKYFCCIL